MLPVGNGGSGRARDLVGFNKNGIRGDSRGFDGIQGDSRGFIRLQGDSRGFKGIQGDSRGCGPGDACGVVKGTRVGIRPRPDSPGDDPMDCG
eukprot:1187869-Prorocentrum_minimum.AAC.5